MLSRFFRTRGRPARFQTPKPTQPTCAIGDVHGCLVQLEKMLTQVPQDHRVLLVGDYVDRGEHSAEVLRLLHSRPDLTCLRGNHEEMLLNFLNDPVRHGTRWFRYGGLQTLASFGVRGLRPEMAAEELVTCRDSLRDAMGSQLCDWIASLSTWDLSGNILTVHAAADPNSAPDQQTEDTLLWGHPDFPGKERADGVWVVHGHTIVAVPTTVNGRISIDTGAYATGVLSAVCLNGSAPYFLRIQT